MTAKRFIDSVKVMAKGQITIPKDIRKVLDVGTGDRVTFIVQGDSVQLVNSAKYAMRLFQEGMKGAAEKAGIQSDEGVVEFVRELRADG